MNPCGPNGLDGLRYSIGLEFGQVIGVKVDAEADGLAGYPAAVGPYQPPAATGSISGGGIALFVVGLVIVLVGIGLLIKGAQIQKAPAMAIGGAVATVGIVLVAVGKKLRR